MDLQKPSFPAPFEIPNSIIHFEKAWSFTHGNSSQIYIFSMLVD